MPSTRMLPTTIYSCLQRNLTNWNGRTPTLPQSPKVASPTTPLRVVTTLSSLLPPPSSPHFLAFHHPRPRPRTPRTTGQGTLHPILSCHVLARSQLPLIGSPWSLHPSRSRLLHILRIKLEPILVVQRPARPHQLWSVVQATFPKLLHHMPNALP